MVKKVCFQSIFKSISGLWCSQVVWEGIPQTWGCVAESPVAHDAEVGFGDNEEVGVGGAEASGDRFLGEEVGHCRRSGVGKIYFQGAIMTSIK